MITSNGTNGVHHTPDEDIDTLYAWFPPQVSAPAPLPEAAFSLTLKGKLDGTEAMLTIRGATATEFKANLQAVRGLLEPLTAPSISRPVPESEQRYCPRHGAEMQHNQKEGRSWWSHQTSEGWCRGR